MTELSSGGQPEYLLGRPEDQNQGNLGHHSPEPQVTLLCTAMNQGTLATTNQKLRRYPTCTPHCLKSANKGNSGYHCHIIEPQVNSCTFMVEEL